jgi:hypothetical protein
MTYKATFGLSCVIVASTLGIIGTLAKAQLETCPNGYYLATNNLCYPYQQQIPHDSQDIQNCKIAKDGIDMDKALGVNASMIAPMQRMHNDTCGS